MNKIIMTAVLLGILAAFPIIQQDWEGIFYETNER